MSRARIDLATTTVTWVTTGQIADAVGFHRRTIERYIEQGKLPAKRKGVRNYIVAVSDARRVFGIAVSA